MQGNKIKLYISKAADYDLFCLYKSVGGRGFAKIARDIITCYLSETQYRLPQIIWDIPPNGNKEGRKTCIITLPQKTYEEIEYILSKVQNRKQSAFIKSIIRNGMGQRILDLYFADCSEEDMPNIPSHNISKFSGVKEKTYSEPNKQSAFLQPIENKEDKKLEKEYAEVKDHKNEYDVAIETINDNENKDVDSFDELADLFGGISVM